jgi:hypothetical protein
MDRLPSLRRQLTLFADDPMGLLAHVRTTYNPVQAALIAAHVTLCREDELEPLDAVWPRLKGLDLGGPLVLDMGAAERFSEGQGVLLPAIGGLEAFADLRRRILAHIDTPRVQAAHLTLMHPRNATCTDAIFAEIAALELPRRLVFYLVDLIEQVDGGMWQTLDQCPL